MADITMCKGDGCPMREQCHRFTVEPNPYWQSYFYGTPYDHENKSCDQYFMRRNYVVPTAQKGTGNAEV